MKKLIIPVLWVVPVVGIVFTAGCGGESEIKTYRVAKEDSTPKVPAPSGEMAGTPPMMAPQSGAALPKLSWTLPKGWTELPAGDGIRKAGFQITGADGKNAQVVIIPLPGASNIELESVNMWRKPLGLPALNKEQLAAQATPVQVGDANGSLFDMVSAEGNAGEKAKTRTLGAVAERDGVSWFAKMTGPEDLLDQQKDAFVSFLKSIKFEQMAPAQLAAAEAPVSTNSKHVPAEGDASNFKVPANWQQKAPGPMVAAAYAVTGAEGQGDVSISKFPGDVGGLAANINRWRGQLGLQPLGDAEAQKSAEMVEINGKKNAYMVDLKGTNVRTGKPARMVALGVPRGGETWFYKLIGDDVLVGKEKDTFLKFVVSAY